MIGTWSSVSKTCTITKDLVNENIMIKSNGITLDGNGHSITNVYPAGIWGWQEAYDRFDNHYSDIVIKNFHIGSAEEQIRFGVWIFGNNILISNNTIENTVYGIALSFVGENERFIQISNNSFQKSGKSIEYRNQDSVLLVNDNTFDYASLDLTMSDGYFLNNNFKNFNQGIFELGDSKFVNNNFFDENSSRIRSDNTKQNFYIDLIDDDDINFDNIVDYGDPSNSGGYMIPNFWNYEISNVSNLIIEATSLNNTLTNYPIPKIDYVDKKTDSCKLNENMRDFTCDFSEISRKSLVVTCEPDNTSFFPMGKTMVVCKTTEGRHLQFEINVVDTTPPKISIPNDLEVHTSVPSGSKVNFETSSNDVVQLKNDISCNYKSGETYPIGKTNVICSAMDTSGNKSEKSFIIDVISDVPLPVLSVPGKIEVNASTALGEFITFPDITASDALGLKSKPYCDKKSGSFFEIGTTSVRCTAVNNAGFEGHATFSVVVNPPESIVDDLLPTREQLGTEWRFPTNKSVYDELRTRGVNPITYEGFVEDGYRGHIRGSGFDSNFLDLYVYRFNNHDNAKIFYFDHLDYWTFKGGYEEWTPGWNSVNSDECYGRISTGTMTDKISLYCIKNNVVVFVTTTGSAYDMKGESSKFANKVFENLSGNTMNVTQDSDSVGGGCLIATATFDSELAPQVQKLREIRDSKLLQTESGSQFMESFNTFYYSFSPIIADYERENPVFKEIVKIGITPMISTLSLMDYAETESEVLTIGISLIILNGMMYVGLPVFGIMRLRK